MHVNDDHILWEAFKAGETWSFERIFHTHFQEILMFANSLLKNREDAEEVTADAFIKLDQQREKITSLEHIVKFLYVATRNASFNLLVHKKNIKRRDKKLLEALEHEVSVSAEQAMIRKEVFVMIDNLVQQLPTKYREVFKLALYEGCNNAEIEKILQIDPGNVKNYKHRAKLLLRKQLEGLNLDLNLD